MTRIGEPYDDSVCAGCKHCKSKSRKNCFGEYEYTWYCMVNLKPHYFWGCKGFDYEN